ncbi:hypothetical protein HETIRDRAFT_54650 [Heterobasidion irregulare TC 32-1]|uniref:Nudix hydrolase domain-containing protein n=1 Tax=Heterobasidion irregulare (strain TC 32-1) TaxID=747525 RepID=W4KAZ7_HETIT|nr:uncharacterized protein HETIRDRAFT_54650 [Heterobasidion irregulare TC 32-1]ETW82894.1 hypothetical protein HETIRDRAFT_54650 [Heterobasidion irregulare TC 32-1]
MDHSIAPVATLTGLSDQSRACLERLQSHQPEQVDLTTYPASKLASVLILLYDKAGELRVLLTTRSKSLRSHPGQTALPGGKVDETDRDAIHTAYREANEEVRLPLESPHVHTVCTLRPFLSPYRLLVTPVVAYLDDASLLDELQASDEEVEHIFDHPLEGLLDPTISRKESLVPIGGEHWPYETELHNTSDNHFALLGDSLYRMHRFRTTASPIKGLTSDILIFTAEIAYEREPAYERWAPGQLSGLASVRLVLENDGKSVIGYQTSQVSMPDGART